MPKYSITRDAQAYAVTPDLQSAVELLVDCIEWYRPIRVEKYQNDHAHWFLGHWHVFNHTGYHLVEVLKILE